MLTAPARDHGTDFESALDHQESQRFLAEAAAQAERPWLEALARDDLATLLLRLARRLG